ncbi:hypothetical protein PHMEG_0006927 [Phytophthora megakarya]|uniref:Uncharacterized protein n=1 Tax=Phytophthora megakarya TaxID=4795 RepID=A0A225WPX3_9STRA|nr:hypothetical protein PHMEG_0006927 [Phytophthora megakarya]
MLLRAGYGGLENLVEVEHLSDEDRTDLSKLLSEDQDIRRELLVPRDVSEEPSPSDFLNLVTCILAQRKLAALLRVYESQGLARKVFGMSTLLKRMLDRHRVSQVACTLSTSKTTLELDNSSDDARSARRDFVLLINAFKQQVAELLEQAQSQLCESDRDFQRDYRLVNRRLEDRLRGATFKVGRVINFLNCHNARVSGNWPRLKALLEKFKGGSLPPDAWKTQIEINAADEFDADPVAYEYEVESVDEESKVPDTPKPEVALIISTVDLTGSSSTDSNPAKIQRKLFGGSKPKALTDFQHQPSVYAPSMTDTLDLTTAKQLSVTKARENLTQPVIWDKLRADIQELMRSHMSYDEALAAARADAEIHSHLEARHLISMLVCIIYCKSLDRTPWAKPNLRKDIQDDAVEIMAALYDSVTEEEDDEGRDATFSPGDDSQSKPQCRTTPPRQAKRGRDATSNSASKAKPKRASSPPKKHAKSGNGKKSRPGQERK